MDILVLLKACPISRESADPARLARGCGEALVSSGFAQMNTVANELDRWLSGLAVSINTPQVSYDQVN